MTAATARSGARLGGRAAAATRSVFALFVVAAAVPVMPARAAANAAARTTPAHSWVALGAVGGTTLPDASLERYQWDVRPASTFGAVALAGRGRWALGVRVATAQATQAMQLPGGAPDPAAHTTTWETLVRTRAGSLLGIEGGATFGAGVLHLAYHPDRVVVSTAGGDVAVDLTPVTTPTAGAGVWFARALARNWTATLTMDREYHALDTAHRAGDQITYARETFGTWNARMELARRFDIQGKGTSR